MGLERCWVSFSTSLQLLLFAEEACVRTPLQKQQSLPLRPVIPLVARISDQNASGAPPMTVREKTRLEKFRQLLSSHNTDLGECGRWWEGASRGALLPPLGCNQVYTRVEKTTTCRCIQWGDFTNCSVGRW